jgi:hypothetical protein
MRKIISIGTISTIGKKEKSKKELKVSFYPFGDFTFRRKRNMSLASVGIQNTRTSLLFP